MTFRLTIELDIPDRWVNAMSGPGYVLLGWRLIDLRQALGEWLDDDPCDTDAAWRERLAASRGWYELERSAEPLATGDTVIHACAAASGRAGSVIAVHEGAAWVSWAQGASVVAVTELVRIGTAGRR